MKVCKRDIKRYRARVKGAYRKEAWAGLIAGFSKEKLLDKTALILSGPEGKEIPVLRRLGFKDSNIYAVDDNPANVATAKRVNSASEVHAYGCLLSEASLKIKKEGHRLHFVCADFCGNLAGNVFEELSALLSSGVLAGRSRICVTFQKGREPAVFRMLMRTMRVTNRDAVIERLISDAGYVSAKVASGYYQNGPTPMSWVTYELALIDTVNLAYHRLVCDSACDRRILGPIGLAMVQHYDLTKKLDEWCKWRGSYYNYNEHDVMTKVAEKLSAVRHRQMSGVLTRKAMEAIRDAVYELAQEYHTLETATKETLEWMQTRGLGTTIAYFDKVERWGRPVRGYHRTSRPLIGDLYQDFKYYHDKSKGFACLTLHRLFQVYVQYAEAGRLPPDDTEELVDVAEELYCEGRRGLNPEYRDMFYSRPEPLEGLRQLYDYHESVYVEPTLVSEVLAKRRKKELFKKLDELMPDWDSLKPFGEYENFDCTNYEENLQQGDSWGYSTLESAAARALNMTAIQKDDSEETAVD